MNLKHEFDAHTSMTFGVVVDYKSTCFQVQSPVLVVELNLNRVEGTQLRALGLLAVYGFNVTYEVRAPTRPPGPTSCSAIECRLLGHCYARQDYQEFFCSCFEGYSGADCGVGPRCPSTNLCKNGGTCRQMGPAAVSCICAPGYTGDLCEAQLAPPECGIEECAEVCKDGTACDCNPKDTDFASAKFETGLQVVGQVENISQEIVKELTTYLKASNITLEDEIEILNISSEAAGGARTARTDSEKDLRGIVKVTVSLGGAMCLVAALLQLLSLVAGSKARLPILLKAATAATHSAAVLALLECDTRQSACPGPLGWVCAACWCAGCAALCAQPLLLHAELAASATRAPSVGLLAGVCTLCWLTARLWGGAPLQLGAAANAVCGAGAALLAALTLCLALCAARTLRTYDDK
ncbi:hypothetical protein B5X24_HaOG213780 [Helicoverpa armigera]|nr:hypothetical protein B5X24_HaOG213780 [Helicoverpa armigera]